MARPTALIQSSCAAVSMSTYQLHAIGLGIQQTRIQQRTRSLWCTAQAFDCTASTDVMLPP